MDSEIQRRQEAIRLWLAGCSQAEISRQLNKSPKWVRYWIARYDPDEPLASLRDASSAPKQPYSKWSDEVKQMVVQSRHRRVEAEQPGYTYALTGAQAIYYELQALGVDPVPPVRTIHSWLKTANLVRVRAQPLVSSKASKPYPAPDCTALDAVQQLDLKGPIYLLGSDQKHYLVALRDVHSKAVAMAATQNRQAETIVDCLVAAWQRLGLPKTLQMDNGMEFRGSNRYPRSFGKVVHLCVQLGVEPLFVPPREPWRNGFIENFNGQAQRLLLNHDHFTSFEQLQQGVQRLEQAVNTTHRLPALDGQTPAEYRASRSARQLPANFDWRQCHMKLDRGSVAFIRLVRKSGRITLHADDKFDIDPDLAWQYVLARVDVPTRKLLIYHDKQLIHTFDF